MTEKEQTLVELREAIREVAEIIIQWEDGLIQTPHALNLSIHKLTSVIERGGGS